MHLKEKLVFQCNLASYFVSLNLFSIWAGFFKTPCSLIIAELGTARPQLVSAAAIGVDVVETIIGIVLVVAVVFLLCSGHIFVYPTLLL